MHGDHWQPQKAIMDDLENFRNNGSTIGLDGTTSLKEGRDGTTSAQSTFLYKSLVSLCGAEFFKEHYQCGVGNPVTEECDGYQLTISDVQAVYALWQLVRTISIPKHIVEIGPGYGALTALLRKVYPTAKMTLVDLPERHEMLRYYISNTCGMNGVEITTELPTSASLVIAQRCLMEMPFTEVVKYIRWIQSVGVHWFYLVNRYVKRNILKAYPFDGRWLAAISQPTLAQANMHEFLLCRTQHDSGWFLNQLESLPPYKMNEYIVDFNSGKLVLSPINKPTAECRDVA